MVKIMESAIPLEPLSYACIDPRRVRRGLSYGGRNQPSELLDNIDNLLLERLNEIIFNPTKILELGRSLGHFANLLQQQQPKAQVISMGLVPPSVRSNPFLKMPWKKRPAALTGDPLHLPFDRNQFDLVFANMMLHWSVDPMATLREIRRVLKPGGLLLLATVGEETLHELKKSLAECDQMRFGRIWNRVTQFPSLRRLGDMLAATGFVLPVADRDKILSQCPDTHTLLAELKRMGAVNAHRQRATGLMGKGYPDQLASIYKKNFGTESGSIHVTLEILFGHAWKSDPSGKISNRDNKDNRRIQ